MLPELLQDDSKRTTKVVVSFGGDYQSELMNHTEEEMEMCDAIIDMIRHGQLDDVHKRITDLQAFLETLA